MKVPAQVGMTITKHAKEEQFAVERMVERGRDGFERKIGQTEIGIEYTDRPEPKRGFLAGLFSRKKKEEKVEAGPR